MDTINSQPSIKILLVDDREDNLFSIQTILEKDGYIFRKANSGKEALKALLKEVDFTLILMDVEMPDINGFETASLIYERDKLRHIPIIFITANSYSEEYVFRGYQTGAVDYIYKPINSDLLRAKVSVFVELYKKNHLLMAHEQKLQEINLVLEERVKERTEEIIHKNRELEDANGSLKRVNNDLDNFVYTASHDLKAPVSNIEGLLYALKDSLIVGEPVGEEALMILDMIENSVSKFKGTIADLSEISKIQKNFDDEVSIIDCKEILDDILISIRESIQSSNAEIKINVDGCPEIKFSKKNFKSILYNLITNAIKYREEGRIPEIFVETKVTDDWVILTVKDNGLGIQEKDFNKVFSMFKRVHTHVEGSGVGLYIVKRIVDNSGGKVEVESKVGEGSTFRVYIKRNEEN